MLVIGIDVGTTGTKSILANGEGAVLAGAYREYELKSADDGKVTQNAEDWWRAIVETVREIGEKHDLSDVTAIGISTQGASMLAVDKEGRPLCDVMTWMDSRASKEVEYLEKTVTSAAIYEKCGWNLTAAGDAAKILWLKNNEPDVFSSAACFPSTLEFVNHRLTGRFVCDPTNAAIRQLFNIKDCKWDSEILNAVGVGEEKLPTVLPVAAEVGTVTQSAAEALGIPFDTVVYNGAHDQYCAALGSGAVEAGDMLLATGTAWVVLGVTDSLLYTESRISPGIHPAGKYGAMASLVSAGSALKWYKNIIDDTFSGMDLEASRRAESAKDLLVYPYVAGAGFPHNAPDAGGAMLGFTLKHDRYDIARAFMEGVAFEARYVLEQFEKAGMKISKLMMTGGAARSDVWSEIVACVTGCDIYRTDEPETCCVGAAMTALVGSGVFENYAECRKRVVRFAPVLTADKSQITFYNGKYERYKAGLESVLKR